MEISLLLTIITVEVSKLLCFNISLNDIKTEFVAYKQTIKNNYL